MLIIQDKLPKATILNGCFAIYDNNIPDKLEVFLAMEGWLEQDDL